MAIDALPQASALTPAQRQLVEMARGMFECRGDIVRLSKALPHSAEELDGLLAALIRQQDLHPFSLLWMAALVAGREVDGRHVGAALKLCPNARIMLPARSQFTGDPAACMLEAMREDCLDPGSRTVGMLFVVLWWQENRSEPLPETAIGELRKLARIPLKKWREHEIHFALFHILLTLVDDASVKQILDSQKFRVDPHIQESGRRRLREIRRVTPLEWVRELKPAGSGLKRESPKQGRNGLCLCGSGRKYKRCCEGKQPAAPETVADAASSPMARFPQPSLEAVSAKGFTGNGSRATGDCSSKWMAPNSGCSI